MINKKILNFSYIEIFLILSYLTCWFSISTSFYDVLNFLEKENNNFNSLINFLRQSLNLLLFPILLTLFLKEKKNIYFKNELLFIFAFFYFIFQIPGLLFTGNSTVNIIYVISALNILFIFILVNIYFDKKKYLIFVYITLLMLLLITGLNYKTFVNFFSSESSSSLYTFFFSNETFLGKISPRSTGSSRTLLLIMIISFLIFSEFFKKNVFLKFIIYILISSLILLFQSRTSIVMLITFILLNYIYENNFSLKNTLKYFIVYIFLPIIFVYFILIFKEITQNKDLLKNINDNGIKKNLLLLTDDFKRPIDPDTYSSGRVQDWKNILSKSNKSLIYGYGAQGDRFLINQTASNGILYSFASSGILGLIPFVSFSILSLWIISKKFLKNTKSRLIINYYSSIVVFLLLLRSILESSYALFSIDFIVIYTFINYLYNFSLKRKNGN